MVVQPVASTGHARRLSYAPEVPSNVSRKHRRRHAPKIVRRTQPGAPPGEVVADPSQPKPQIHVIAYGPSEIVEQDAADAAAAHALVGQHAVTWINVEGLGDAH